MPRRIAGGDVRRLIADAPAQPASTMPRRIAGGDAVIDVVSAAAPVRLQRCPGELPGETASAPGCWRRCTFSFNDAPANCRGRPPPEQDRLARRRVASTMPRRIAGGDPKSPGMNTASDSSLQRCPGELPGETWPSWQRWLGRSRCFNDAPANCRGRQGAGHHDVARAGGASTMPRRIAGGDQPRPRLGRHAGRASTMPRRIAGGDSMAPTHCLPKRDSTNCERCRNIAWPAARATGSGLQIVKEHDALQ